jgi:hypothetical protein
LSATVSGLTRCGIVIVVFVIIVIISFILKADRKEGIVYEVILKRFENQDEVRRFEKGTFELVQVGAMTIGRASYEPGWKWSVHVGGATGAKSCLVEHVGMVLSGRATAAMDDVPGH